MVQKTFIDGRVYFDRQRDIAARAELEKEKKALIEKEKKSGEKPRPPQRRPGEAKKPAEKSPPESKPEQKPQPPGGAR